MSRASGNRAVIVGSGAGASISAMVLSHNGWDVTIFEKGPKLIHGWEKRGPIKTVFSNDELKFNRRFEEPDPLSEPRAFRANPGTAPSMRLALRAGFAALMVALASGAAMIARGVAEVQTGHQQAAYHVAAALKPAHFVTMHAVLVLPAHSVGDGHEHRGLDGFSNEQVVGSAEERPRIVEELQRRRHARRLARARPTAVTGFRPPSSRP